MQSRICKLGEVDGAQVTADDVRSAAAHQQMADGNQIPTEDQLGLAYLRKWDDTLEILLHIIFTLGMNCQNNLLV